MQRLLDSMPMDPSLIWQDHERMTRFDEEDISKLLEEVLKVFRKENNLLRIDRGKTLFVGDTHGNFAATKAAVRIFLSREFDRIVFLGDYVDRGHEQLENINYIFSLKLDKPMEVFVLRGNHETISTNSRYGFWQAVTKRYSETLYQLYNTVFSYLPLAAIAWNRMFVVHGGIAKGLMRVEEIDDLPRGEAEPSSDIVLQLLWNDPSESVNGFTWNDQRGGFYCYGRDAFHKFMDRNNLKMLLRSHEVFPYGYKYFFDGRLLSIFSSTGYCGSPVRGKVAQLSTDGKMDVADIIT